MLSLKKRLYKGFLCNFTKLLINAAAVDNDADSLK